MTNSGSRSVRSCSGPKTATGTSQWRAKSRSTTDSNFEPIFRANGGVSVLKSSQFPPSNKQWVRAYIRKVRNSVSPTSSQHRRFLDILEAACSERDIKKVLQLGVLKDPNDTNAPLDIDYPRYRANADKQWVAFPMNVGFNNGLSAPKPDLMEGYAQEAFPPSIQQLGGSATLVYDHPMFIGLPHFTT